MKVIKTEKQKDNLAKAFWDIGKITIATLVLAPLAKPSLLNLLNIILGLLVGLLFGLVGYILDGKEIMDE